MYLAELHILFGSSIMPASKCNVEANYLAVPGRFHQWSLFLSPILNSNGAIMLLCCDSNTQREGPEKCRSQLSVALWINFLALWSFIMMSSVMALAPDGHKLMKSNIFFQIGFSLNRICASISSSTIQKGSFPQDSIG